MTERSPACHTRPAVADPSLTGLVVICAGTTGYNAVIDLRCLWM